MLDSSFHGYISLQEMEPLLAISSNVTLRSAVTAAILRGSRPAAGLSLREFAAVFHGEQCVSMFYANTAVEEMSASGSACVTRKAQTAHQVLGAKGKVLQVSELEAQMQAVAEASCPPPFPTPPPPAVWSTTPAVWSPTPAQPLMPAKGVGLQVPAGAAVTPPRFAPAWSQCPSSPSAVSQVDQMRAFVRHASSPVLKGVYTAASLEAEMERVAAAPRESPPQPAAPRDDPEPEPAQVRGAKMGRQGPRRSIAGGSGATPEKRETRRSSLGQVDESKRRWRVKEVQSPAPAVSPEAAESAQLQSALAEIQRLKQEVAAAATKDAELHRLKEELAAAKEEQANAEVAAARLRRASIGGVDSRDTEDDDTDDDDEDAEHGIAPLPPDSECWEWPLSRHEKQARVQMLERQIHAADRSALIKERRRSSLGSMRHACMSDSDED